jgi:hypothetical protein
MQNLQTIARRAAQLRPNTHSGSNFQSMAGNQPIYDGTDYSVAPDFTEVLHVYNHALWLTPQEYESNNHAIQSLNRTKTPL